MERGVKHRPRRRSPLPFLLLAVAVVGCAFAVAVAAVVPMEADIVAPERKSIGK